jgi:hypothetical protein
MWTSAIKSNVYTAINTRVLAKFKSKYSNINCGTELKRKTTPKFPYVLIKKLPGTEEGQTLDKKGVNAILTTFQIEVYSNVSESICDEISNYIADIMTGNLKFSVMGEPYPDYESTDEYRYVARYSRLIGASDIIKW